MKPSLVIDIRQLYSQPILAGAGNGQAFLPQLISTLSGVSPNAIVVLDLRRVEIVTASFFRAAFRAFRDHARSACHLFPVLANANSTTKEEIHLYAESTGDAFIHVTLNKRGEVESPTLLGKIDDKQARALQVLLETGETHAADLCQKYPETPSVSSSAWSNRLAPLAVKGILFERTEGRLKKYRPIFGEMRLGA